MQQIRMFKSTLPSFILVWTHWNSFRIRLFCNSLATIIQSISVNCNSIDKGTEIMRLCEDYHSSAVFKYINCQTKTDLQEFHCECFDHWSLIHNTNHHGASSTNGWCPICLGRLFATQINRTQTSSYELNSFSRYVTTSDMFPVYQALLCILTTGWALAAKSYWYTSRLVKTLRYF